MDFTLDGGHQADIDEVELILLFYRSNRFCTVNGVGTPLFPMSFKQCRHAIHRQAFTDAGRRVAAHLPQGDLLVFNDEQERRTK